MAAEATDDFASRYSRSIASLYRSSGAARWGLAESSFAQSLSESLRSWTAALPAAPSPAEVEAYMASLRVEDLALASACREGLAPAWDHFVERYRDGLYAAARAIAHDESRACELADSLYAELYGLGTPEARRSLFGYFHGRSSLKTWLRAVIAQRHVDLIRAGQRFEPLDDSADQSGASADASDDPPDPDRALYVESIGRALEAAIAELKPRDRLRLNFYYAEELTLAQIGAIMHEHESTVSRRLARSRKQLRQQVERTLRRGMHLNEEQIQLCYAYAMESWTADLRRLLAGSR